MRKTLSQIYADRADAGDLNADPAQEALLPLFEEIRCQVEAPPPKRSILWRVSKPKPPEGKRGAYVWGGVGRGKSMLMDLLFEHTEIADKRRVHFHAFMQEIHGALHEARKTGVEDALVPVAKAITSELRFLCFDEMQITDITDAMLVGRLFDLLFAAGVVIVTTSNRPPQDLYKDGLNRNLFVPFIDLLSERLTVLEMASDTDYRQNRLEGAARYFAPLGPASRDAMNGIWQDLTGGHSEGLTLKVKGREIAIPSFQSGVARLTFWDLCGQPLGAADYLALASAVRVLLLDDIPQLGRSNFNEAKRFVTLVDALYEAGVTLIASAAAMPETLYIEGEGSFEFERTASRLREMQAESWGQGS